ncbi:MAG: hypothetical protein UR28_C0016G0004 [Candidatus Peregrinibacteria bacterium GW2011_GWF2_33_10]|nr:MAG: hypothetical protein UR28_C0016G0004 [Candidatus Peregrinibacteria bacterium GW2011_GWF2_33_10]OGJ45847.1 MAG: hypothetical protein A2263_03585 [Candidatus Peregrinibacteria bacterium RIFOXYA2_FULL_33_21]OGJ46484.1 MAG: hypothetical protein A2272_03530 [Candidatus Peregrinibacteria bacterium RIFOXYA12_FULL_33_12]OGJ51361.1 MAG: hypothetical protein A2307_02310 [Candidatus Peregrinibacteria bacterium RIFOXYB2_FULL_33_20]
MLNQLLIECPLTVREYVQSIPNLSTAIEKLKPLLDRFIKVRDKLREVYLEKKGYKSGLCGHTSSTITYWLRNELPRDQFDIRTALCVPQRLVTPYHFVTAITPKGFDGARRIFVDSAVLQDPTDRVVIDFTDNSKQHGFTMYRSIMGITNDPLMVLMSDLSTLLEENDWNLLGLCREDMLLESLGLTNIPSHEFEVRTPNFRPMMASL